MEALLEIRGLTKQFGGLTAVDGVDLSIRKGEIRALIGPNGSGKTTVLNLVSGVYTPTNGVILFNGKNIARKRPHVLVKEGMLRTFQSTRLFKDLSVLENVMIGMHSRTKSGLIGIVLGLPSTAKEEVSIREKSEVALEFVGLLDKAPVLARNLPFGQQRLVEIARGLVSQPGLFLLDEPAAGMNPSETEKLVRLLERIRDRGTTIFLVEHDMNLVMELSDTITVLNFGRRIAEGAPQEVQNNDEVIEAYLGKRSQYAQSD